MGETLNKNQGSLLWRFSKKFQFAADNVIPDPLVFCMVLTILLYVCGIAFTSSTPIDMLQYWFDGIWSQIAFAFQMSFMVVVCSVAARSRQVKHGLSVFAGWFTNPIVAIIMLMIFGYFASFLNWAFGTIATPILAMEMSKKTKGLHFPMLVAAGYSTMILGQCMGPSASVYALLASSDHFLVGKIGVLTQDITTYNPMNIILWFILAIGTILLTIVARPPKNEIVEFDASMHAEEEEEVEDEVNDTVAKKLNNSRIIMYAVGIAGLVNIIHSFVVNGFLASLSLNFVIFIFLIADFFLYSSPRKFVGAFRENMGLATDVMIQFPLYGGISGMMMTSGLGIIIVGGITSVATAATLPVFSYLSASLLNLFIPSQGGQWIVQGDIIIDAAKQLNANIPDVINAFVYGDEATNLLQPLYVIPALAVVKMKLKDVWGYMAFIWVFWFVATCIGLLVIPKFLV